MISVIDVYEDCRDQLNEEQNGQFSYALFNRVSWRAQLKLIDWLSGDVASIQPPEPYLTEKNKAWLAPFLKKLSAVVTGGIVNKPSDYYRLDNWYILGASITEDCDTGIRTTTEASNRSGELLDGNTFSVRCESFVTGLKPSMEHPIAKLVDNHFEFKPSDPGSITIEYLRYPAKAHISGVIDPVYHNEVPDLSTLVDFEWDGFAQDMLVWLICDLFFNRTREQAGKQANAVTQKTIRQ